ncbi:hypothetical protein Salmuc_02068 [Salipiger mucosus DSM 16094]|uniref:Exopolysaccharide synthesis, ExoD n=1 Tax=Salipiger mucosus DSM 16094 TaxID=1123237 RepID=S9RZN8_9RHOB|nr:hypothetical protein Salmuc_02068 [Salipiger mucosus DSM 16094]
MLRLRPITRRLERILRERHSPLLDRRHDRLLGSLLFLIAFALFIPLPFTGWFPAISLFVIGVGLVERDGVATTVGLAIGGASVVLTAGILISLGLGAEAMLD